MSRFVRKTRPQPIPVPEFKEAELHVTERLRAARKAGSVLVRLDIDAEGRVVSSRAIGPTWLDRFEEAEVILVDGRTGERLPDPPPRSQDPQVREAALEVARLLRFKPAMRGSRAVRYRKFRMTFSFE